MGNIEMHTIKTNKILKLLSGLKAEARQRYKAEIKGIFGSYTRGEEGSESDIDILVEFENNANLIDFVGLSLFLEEKLKQHVDVVPESAIRKELKSTILREATYI